MAVVGSHLTKISVRLLTIGLIVAFAFNESARSEIVAQTDSVDAATAFEPLGDNLVIAWHFNNPAPPGSDAALVERRRYGHTSESTEDLMKPPSRAHALVTVIFIANDLVRLCLVKSLADTAIWGLSTIC